MPIGAVVGVDPQRMLSTRLSQKYLREDPRPEPPEVVRLIVRVAPLKVNEFSLS